MSEMRFPLCPICKDEVLLPFSTSQYEVGEKVFGSWVCTNCGFFITTLDTRAIDIRNDIKTGFHLPLRRGIKELREEYKK